MFYRRLFNLKEDTQSITNLETAHWNFCLLGGILTFHAQVLQHVFAKFGDSYTLLDVYNILKSWNWFMHIMRLVLWSLHRVQGLSLHQLRQPDQHIKSSFYTLTRMLLVLVLYLANFVATPLWPSVGVKPNTPKVGDLESSGTPECLEFDSKAQNTSHLGCSWCHWKGLEA
jgi:hypothetical protein